MKLILNIIAGVICGILINYFSDVLPISRRLTRPKCKACDRPFTLKDYLFSYKCSNCGHKKSARTFIVLISTVVICVLLNYFPFSVFGFLGALPLLIFMGIVLTIDIEHRLVLLETSILGFVICLIYGIILRGLARTLLGALGGFAIMLLFYLLGLVFNVVMGKIKNQKIEEVAFGFGDVSMGTVLGLLTGWPSITGALIIAILAFGVFSLLFILGLILTKRYQAFASALPFVPFLILGAVVLFYL